MKINPARGEFVELMNPCPTPESLFNLCDLDWVHEHFKDDLRLKIILAQENIKRGTPENSYEEIAALAREHGIELRIESAAALAAALERLYTRAALLSTMRIVDKVEEFAAAHSKTVLYVLSYTVADAGSALATGKRVDQDFVDFLRHKGLPYVDDLQFHKADLNESKLDVRSYLNRYYIGHYNPLGNVFQAFALNGKLIEILDPKPIAYPERKSKRTTDDAMVNPGKLN